MRDGLQPFALLRHEVLDLLLAGVELLLPRPQPLILPVEFAALAVERLLAGAQALLVALLVLPRASQVRLGLAQVGLRGAQVGLRRAPGGQRLLLCLDQSGLGVLRRTFGDPLRLETRLFTRIRTTAAQEPPNGSQHGVSSYSIRPVGDVAAACAPPGVVTVDWLRRSSMLRAPIVGPPAVARQKLRDGPDSASNPSAWRRWEGPR